MHRWVGVDGLEVFGAHYRHVPGDFVGFTAVRDGLRGFFDGPDRRVDEQAGQWRDGVVPAESTMTGRVLSIEGMALARSWSELLALGRVLRGVLAGGGFAELVFQPDERPLRLRVGLLGTTVFRADPWQPRRARYQIQFRAPHPVWQGEPRSFEVRAGGSVQVWHHGEVQAAPVVRFVGPLATGGRVTVGARAFSLGTAVAAGEVVEVDQATMRAVSSTRGVLMGVVTGVPLRVDAGGEVQARFSGSGAGRVVLVVVDAHV